MNSNTLNLVVIYRPPRSLQNTCAFSTFLSEFSFLLEVLNSSKNEFILLGDYNIHIDQTFDADARAFSGLCSMFSLTQHVSESTHSSGHTLDLTLTSTGAATLISQLSVTDALVHLLDHKLIKFHLNFTSPGCQKEVISSRNLKRIDLSSLATDFESSDVYKELRSTNRIKSVNQLYTEFEYTCRSLIDKHAPLKERVITVRPSVPWFTPEVSSAKRLRRRLERTYRRTLSPSDKFNFIQQSKCVGHLLVTAKRQYYIDLIESAQSNQKALFKVVDKLLDRNKESPLPDPKSNVMLAESFSDYFIEKINLIRQNIARADVNRSPSFGTQLTTATCVFTDFQLVDTDNMLSLIRSNKPTNSEADCLPTLILIRCGNTFAPVLAELTNMILISGEFPDSMKRAYIKPLLKKSGLDRNILKNYRPVSNLSFISKIVERVVAAQIKQYITDNNLYPEFQSAYRSGHSTESALLRVHNDIAVALDRGDDVILVLLDLSSAFDTIDQFELIKMLEVKFGIRGTVLKWMESYLTQRMQQVSVDGSVSSQTQLKYGVPQGSVLGPLLFILYTSPLCDIIKEHGIGFHLFADDTQLYLSFSRKSTPAYISAKAKMEECIDLVKCWMNRYMLKLNDEKTVILNIHSQTTPAQPPVLSGLRIGNSEIFPTSAARNIGVIFDDTLSMKNHIDAVCKSCFLQLRNLSKIRSFIPQRYLESLVHAFVTSRLDYGNALLCGTPAYQLQRLQRVQNVAARLVANCDRNTQSLQLLHDLHWLPVVERIRFKINITTYKCLHGTAPTYLQELIKPYHPCRILRSADRNLLEVPRSKTVRYGRRAYSFVAPCEWNSLPLACRTCTSFSEFKRKLKTHLFPH